MTTINRQLASNYFEWPSAEVVSAQIAEQGTKVPYMTKIEVRQLGTSGLAGLRYTLSNGHTSKEFSAERVKEQAVPWRVLCELSAGERIKELSFKTASSHMLSSSG